VICRRARLPSWTKVRACCSGEGGQSIGRATVYPPPLEIEVDGGTYVLVDDGPIEQWHYQFVREG